jgi:hypothetical protein
MDYGDCPFLRPSRSITQVPRTRPDGDSVGLYCALPMRRVRVPTRLEVEMFCRPNNFEECPHYRRHARAR